MISTKFDWWYKVIKMDWLIQIFTINCIWENEDMQQMRIRKMWKNIIFNENVNEIIRSRKR